MNPEEIESAVSAARRRISITQIGGLAAAAVGLFLVAQEPEPLGMDQQSHFSQTFQTEQADGELRPLVDFSDGDAIGALLLLGGGGLVISGRSFRQDINRAYEHYLGHGVINER